MSSTELNDVSTYKDSGVPWLGIIPVGWSVIRLKDVGKSIIGLTYAPEDVLDDDAGVLVLRSSNIQQGELSLLDNVYVAKKIPRNLTLRIGDILICSRNGSRNLIGKNITIDERTVGQTFGAFMTVYRSKYSNFLRYFFNSRIFESQSGLYMSSTINQLTINTLNNFSFVLPAANEQTAIAADLDIKTARIDRRMDLLDKKVTHYGKLRQSLINETVIRGLDRSVSMKDSGVDWIGEVPEHWAVTAITNITDTVSHKNHPNEELLSVYRDYGVIIKSSRDDNNNKAGADLSSYKLVEPGFLVINKMKAWQGSLGVSEFRGIVSPAYITCKTNKKIVDRSYLHHLLRCRNYINEYNRLSFGVRVDQWDMRYDDFKYVPVLLPPMSEQAEIAKYLDEKTAQIDRIVTAINTQIDKLKDLRKALINDVVTGKIRVASEGLAI